jgi:hypothetical protein
VGRGGLPFFEGGPFGVQRRRQRCQLGLLVFPDAGDHEMAHALAVGHGRDQDPAGPHGLQ